MVLNKEHDFEKNVQGLFQGFCGFKKKAFLFLFFLFSKSLLWKPMWWQKNGKKSLQLLVSKEYWEAFRKPHFKIFIKNSNKTTSEV